MFLNTSGRIIQNDIVCIIFTHTRKHEMFIIMLIGYYNAKIKAC